MRCNQSFGEIKSCSVHLRFARVKDCHKVWDFALWCQDDCHMRFVCFDSFFASLATCKDKGKTCKGVRKKTALKSAQPHSLKTRPKKINQPESSFTIIREIGNCDTSPFRVKAAAHYCEFLLRHTSYLDSENYYEDFRELELRKNGLNEIQSQINIKPLMLSSLELDNSRQKLDYV